jgi:hypothetical protein
MQPKTIVNVGSADGYYAAGPALRLPGAIVHAYDLASSAREMTRETARINGVAERVLVHGRCRHFIPALDLLVCDIEEGEGDLLHLDPASLARLVRSVASFRDNPARVCAPCAVPWDVTLAARGIVAEEAALALLGARELGCL